MHTAPVCSVRTTTCQSHDHLPAAHGRAPRGRAVSQLRGGGRDRAEIMAALDALRRQRDAGEVSQDEFQALKHALKEVRSGERGTYVYLSVCLSIYLSQPRPSPRARRHLTCPPPRVLG